MANERTARQIRSCSQQFATREAADDLYIEGYFAVFNSEYPLWEGASEIVKPAVWRHAPRSNSIWSSPDKGCLLPETGKAGLLWHDLCWEKEKIATARILKNSKVVTQLHTDLRAVAMVFMTRISSEDGRNFLSPKDFL